MKELGRIMQGKFDETTYVSANRRPLLEMGAPPALRSALREEGVLFDQVRCPYLDSRKDHTDKTMNASALQEIRSHKQELFKGFAWIHHNYFNGEKVTQVSAEQVEELSRISLNLPSFLVLRAVDPIPPDQIPDLIGNMYKASDGINSAAVSMLRKPSIDSRTDPEGIYTFADTQKLLINEADGVVCAAPKYLITESLTALLYGKHGDQRHSELDALVPNFTSLHHYSNLCNAFELSMKRVVQINDALTKPQENSEFLTSEKAEILAIVRKIVSLRESILREDPHVSPPSNI